MAINTTGKLNINNVLSFSDSTPLLHPAIPGGFYGRIAIFESLKA